MDAGFPHVRLDGPNVTLILRIDQEQPSILWLGPQLAPDTDPASLAALGARAEANASPAVEPVLPLTPKAGQGWIGRPVLAAHRDGVGWASHANTGEWRALLQPVAPRLPG